jgi:hypothetical protein
MKKDKITKSIAICLIVNLTCIFCSTKNQEVEDFKKTEKYFVTEAENLELGLANFHIKQSENHLLSRLNSKYYNEYGVSSLNNS